MRRDMLLAGEKLTTLHTDVLWSRRQTQQWVKRTIADTSTHE
jgi:hypothetical protein